MGRCANFYIYGYRSGDHQKRANYKHAETPLTGAAMATPLVKFLQLVRERGESAPSSYRSRLHRVAELLGIGWPLNYPAVFASAQHSEMISRKSAPPSPPDFVLEVERLAADSDTNPGVRLLPIPPNLFDDFGFFKVLRYE